MTKSINRNQITRIALIAALPLCLFVVGCNQKSDSSSDAASTANRDANAAAANADNSIKNARDRADAALTPGDQGNSAADVAITQKVRKMIVSGPNDYSTTAKNIKIITDGGKVTLRGPVNTPAEKAGIVGVAKTVAGEGNVDDQLEVKTNQ